MAENTPRVHSVPKVESSNPQGDNGGLLRVMVDTFLPAWYGTYGNLLSYERFVTSRSGSLSVTTSFVPLFCTLLIRSISPVYASYLNDEGFIV